MRLTIAVAITLLLLAPACSDRGCDGSLVEVGGVRPDESYWTRPFDGERAASLDEVELPFRPPDPGLGSTPTIIWTRSGIGADGRISRLHLAPGASTGPRIAWAYEIDQDRPFFVQQALVGYEQAKLEAEAAECRVSRGEMTNPGFSMTELEDGTDALLIAQSNVISVTWIYSADLLEPAVVEGYDVVKLETTVRAPGDRFTVDEVLAIANAVRR